MNGKTGGAIAVGTVVVAITYMTAGFRSDSSPAGLPASSPPNIQLGFLGGRDSSRQQKPFDEVTVFYATDRAVASSLSPGLQREARIGIVLAAAGIVMFSGWFLWNGRTKTAMTCLGTVTAALALILWKAPISNPRGIDESYVSGIRYGAERGELDLGYCVVSIPRTHQTGEMENPSILRLELSARPDRHLMLQEVVRQEGQDFYSAVRQRVAQSPQHDLFVFVHGFNVNFESAARRTAQIAFDLRYSGAPIFFSWPSQGKTWQYTVDETNVAWAVPHLKRFLTELAQNSDAHAINLIAHSMGNRALTQAIYELGYECQQERKLFQQVILAAPDIDADVFREQIAPQLTRFSSRVTLYASASDEALAASKLVHGSRRAGESTNQPVIIPGMETIDVATTELGPLGHSYYGSCPLLLQDLAAILQDAQPATERPWLAPIRAHGAPYWRMADSPAVAANSFRTP